jgi:hypothetical protein
LPQTTQRQWSAIVHHAIIDITRAWPASEQEIVDKVVDSNDRQYSVVEVVGFDHQENAVTTTETRHFRKLGPPIPEAEIVEQIAQIVQNFHEQNPEGSIDLFSFHPQVVAATGRLAGPDVPLSAHSISAPLKKGQMSENKADSRWPGEFVPIDDAVALLARILKENGHTSSSKSILKTNVRKLLQAADRRFGKQHSPAAATPGLISILLDAARDRGAIQLEGSDPRVRVWLRPGPAIDVEKGPYTDPEARTKTRSQEFVGILMESGYGPFSDMRLKLYEKVQEIVDDRKGSVNQNELIRQAVDNVRDEAPQFFTRPKREPLPKDEFPWRKLRDFTTRLLSDTPVLLKEDMTPFTPSWATAFTKIFGLVDDWQLELESALMLELVKRCPNIESREIEDLAGALLADRSQEGISRVEQVLSRLFGNKRLASDPNSDYLQVSPALND